MKRGYKRVDPTLDDSVIEKGLRNVIAAHERKLAAENAQCAAIDKEVEELQLRIRVLIGKSSELSATILARSEKLRQLRDAL